MSTPTHVVMAADENVVLGLTVAARSVVVNTTAPVDFTVLHDGISEAARALVEASLPTTGRWSVHWIDRSGSTVGDSARFHLPPAAYYRLEIDSLLPESLERCVYLDTDVLVRGDIAELSAIDLDGAVMGAARSINFPSLGTRGALDHWRSLDLDPRLPYFNSGVMVVDLGAWRAADVTAGTLRFLRSELSTGRTADQEGLNVALAGRWRALDPWWNVQTPMLDDQHGAHLLYDDADIDRCRRDPAIVHFLDRPKPWQRGCRHPRRDEWLAAAEATAFSPIRLERPSIRAAVRWRLRRAASALLKGR